MQKKVSKDMQLQNLILTFMLLPTRDIETSVIVDQ